MRAPPLPVRHACPSPSPADLLLVLVLVLARRSMTPAAGAAGRGGKDRNSIEEIYQSVASGTTRSFSFTMNLVMAVRRSPAAPPGLAWAQGSQAGGTLVRNETYFGIDPSTSICTRTATRMLNPFE